MSSPVTNHYQNNLFLAFLCLIGQTEVFLRHHRGNFQEQLLKYSENLTYPYSLPLFSLPPPPPPPIHTNIHSKARLRPLRTNLRCSAWPFKFLLIQLYYANFKAFKQLIILYGAGYIEVLYFYIPWYGVGTRGEGRGGYCPRPSPPPVFWSFKALMMF